MVSILKNRFIVYSKANNCANTISGIDLHRDIDRLLRAIEDVDITI